MQPILEKLNSGKVLVADGAMGTMLFNKGLSSGNCPELFNLTHPQLISEIASEYLNAGADIIQTNTFGGSRLKLKNYNLDIDADRINRTGVELAKKAVQSSAYVSASCGPSGELLKPYGSISENEMFDNYCEQTSSFIQNGADIICIETMTDLNEAVIAVKAAKTISPSIPVISTMTFDKTPKGFYTIMGDDIAKACKKLINAGADIVGSNCGHGIENMIEIAREFKKHSCKPIIIQSNAGIPVYHQDNLIYPETPEYFREKIKSLIEVGVSIIGGCCGTTPNHINVIRSVVDSFQWKN